MGDIEHKTDIKRHCTDTDHPRSMSERFVLHATHEFDGDSVSAVTDAEK